MTKEKQAWRGSVWETPKEAFPPPPAHVFKVLPEEPTSSLPHTAKKGTGLQPTAGSCPPLPHFSSSQPLLLLGLAPKPPGVPSSEASNFDLPWAHVGGSWASAQRKAPRKLTNPPTQPRAFERTQLDCCSCGNQSPCWEPSSHVSHDGVWKGADLGGGGEVGWVGSQVQFQPPNISDTQEHSWTFSRSWNARGSVSLGFQTDLAGSHKYSRSLGDTLDIRASVPINKGHRGVGTDLSGCSANKWGSLVRPTRVMHEDKDFPP